MLAADVVNDEGGVGQAEGEPQAAAPVTEPAAIIPAVVMVGRVSGRDQPPARLAGVAYQGVEDFSHPPTPSLGLLFAASARIAGRCGDADIVRIISCSPRPSASLFTRSYAPRYILCSNGVCRLSTSRERGV